MKSKTWSLFLGVMLTLGSGGLLIGCGDDDGGGGEVCGNGILEGEEVCDGNNLNETTCEDLGYTGGTLACTDSCEFDESGCENDLCGNGQLDAGEECDGTELDGQTCADHGFDGGDLSCNTDCTFNTEECTGGCGNGVVEGDEECDGTDLDEQTCQDLGYASGNLSCNEDCTLDESSCEGTGISGVGGPCEEDADCESEWCSTEVGSGMPSGYCLAQCTQEGACEDPDAMCVSSGFSQFCASWCDPSDDDSKCREGYSCVDLGEGTDGVCWAECSDNAQCTTTNDCDTDTESDSYGFCLTPDEICDNGTDDDFDGLVDCGDDDCLDECPTGEICDNGTDDDGDGLVDCEDAECLQHVACTGIACTAGEEITCDDNLTGESNDKTGSTNTIAEYCAPGNSGWTGPEYTYELNVTENTIITVTLSDLTADVDMIVIRDDGTQGCNPLGCYATSMNIQPDPPSEEATFEAQPGYTYFIVVDGWEEAVATYNLAVTCEQGEICDNGTDDDGDELVDCDDPSCFGQTGCETEENCMDGLDNDMDENVDCDDDDCSDDPYCQATSVFTEGFDTWPPTDWTIEDGSSDGNTWMHCDPNNGCEQELVGSDGPFALVDSDAAGQDVTLEESLISRVIDLSSYTTVYFSVQHFFSQYGDVDDSDFGYIEVSTDGSNWTPVATFGDSVQGSAMLDLSTELAGEANAQIRFRYMDGGEWAWYWMIDNVEIKGS